ncbi:craniofacial development protein 2 [Elysia marginata]|uniref:Craniofacial development protein 2 n=1 Tax=Elysia marginata TaxID=1093978 RepID=A0AAV4J352_9GAST|nr:craniofacial development protein 2 [Elysia marginata]
MATHDFEHCQRYERCQVAKGAPSNIQHPDGHLIARAPLEMVAMDFTRLEVSRDGFEDVLMITDVCTKWLVSIPLKDQTTETIVRALIEHCDLNAKVGDENIGAERTKGIHGCGSINNNGERLVELCASNDLVIGGTLFEHPAIHKLTWYSPNGHDKNQIDHIATTSGEDPCWMYE